MSAVISSRTPEGRQNCCPVCGHLSWTLPSKPAFDATCPMCGCLLWFDEKANESRLRHAPLEPHLCERTASARSENPALATPRLKLNLAARASTRGGRPAETSSLMSFATLASTFWKELGRTAALLASWVEEVARQVVRAGQVRSERRRSSRAPIQCYGSAHPQGMPGRIAAGTGLPTRTMAWLSWLVAVLHAHRIPRGTEMNFQGSAALYDPWIDG